MYEIDFEMASCDCDDVLIEDRTSNTSTSTSISSPPNKARCIGPTPATTGFAALFKKPTQQKKKYYNSDSFQVKFESEFASDFIFK